MTGNKKEQSPTNKEINRQILKLILPVTLEGILEMTGGIVLMGMIGRLDVKDIGALGISMQLTQIVWALFKGLGMGAAVYVAQYHGAGKVHERKEVAIQTVIGVLFLSFFCMLGTYVFAPWALKLFHPDDVMLVQGIHYMRTVCFGFGFWGIVIVVGAILQATGDAKHPMLFVLLMNGVNIGVGYLFIFGVLGWGPIGVSGAGLAMVISQGVAAIIALGYLFKNWMGMDRKCYRFKIDLEMCRKIWRMGFPTSMEIIYWLLAGILVSRAVMTYGDVTYAAHQMGVQAESISYMPAAGFGIAASAFIGQALGKGNTTLAHQYFRRIIRWSNIITAGSVAVLLLFPNQMMGLLTNNEEVIHLGAIYLQMMGLIQIPQNLTGVYSGAMRGAGLTKVPMHIALLGLWLVRVPIAFLCKYLWHLSVCFIWGSMALDLTIRFILTIAHFKKIRVLDRDGIVA